jgi:putative MATE family efflux protein
MQHFDKELVSGSILRSVWKLSWPVTLLNLVNGTHGFVDHILVGRFVESANNEANAAIGVAWQVFLVVVVFIASLFHGMNVLIARYAGMQDRENMGKVFYQALLMSVFLLVGVVAPLGYVCAPMLLDFVHAEADVQRHALPYLRLLFTCGSPLFLTFMLTGAFQASGDAKTPLKLGILSTVLNITISTVLITGVGPFPKLGTIGAALGTILATLVSASIALSLVLRRKTIIPPPPVFTLWPDFAVIKVIARIGLPTGVQGVLLNLGGVFLLKFIGTLEQSAAAQAAYTICYSQLFSLVSWISFGLRSASGTLMGQNIGAGKHARGKQAVLIAAGFGVIWATGSGLIYWFLGGWLLSLFNATGEPVFSYGVSLLHYLSFSGVVLAAALALTGGIQGAGETKIPMYIAFLTQIVVLLGYCSFFYLLGRLTPDHIWMAILVSHISRLVLTYAFFRTERWAHTELKMAH